jgi:metal-responsive CopG/Arc/MetJ family transcriptional regulator
MATKGIGAGKQNVSVTLTDKEKDTLEKLAVKSGMSRSEYCRSALREYIESKTYFSRPQKKQG